MQCNSLAINTSLLICGLNQFYGELKLYSPSHSHIGENTHTRNGSKMTTDLIQRLCNTMTIRSIVSQSYGCITK